MKKQIITSPEGYSQVLNDIRFLLEKAKAQAYKAVDNIRVQTYWQIGERIVREELQHKERADYGKKLIRFYKLIIKKYRYEKTNHNKP